MISDLQKDESIKKVLSNLYQRFGESNFRTVDYWDADLCAIGIKNSIDGEHLFYISTWKISTDHYFVEIENSNGDVILKGEKEGVSKEIDFDRLSELITEYLFLQPIYE